MQLTTITPALPIIQMVIGAYHSDMATNSFNYKLNWFTMTTLIILNFVLAAMNLLLAMINEKIWIKAAYCITAVIWLAVAIINIKTL